MRIAEILAAQVCVCVCEVQGLSKQPSVLAKVLL